MNGARPEVSTRGITTVGVVRGVSPNPSLAGLQRHTKRLVLAAKLNTISRALSNGECPVKAYPFGWAKGMQE